MIRRYPAVPELDLSVERHPDPPPLGAFARLARSGIRLRDDGLTLIAKVPEAVASTRSWPPLDRLLKRHTADFADLAVIVVAARRRFTKAEVVERLRSLTPPPAKLAFELAGGRRRFEALLTGPLTGARLDLAYAIYAQLYQLARVIGEPAPGERREGDSDEGPPARLLRFRGSSSPAP
jgi:hypothetical protein